MNDFADFNSWLGEHLSSFVSYCFDFLSDLFSPFIQLVVNFFSSFLLSDGSNQLGNYFFGFVFDNVKDYSFSFRLVYCVVGTFLTIFVFKRIFIPIFSIIVQEIIDLFIPFS